MFYHSNCSYICQLGALKYEPIFYCWASGDTMTICISKFCTFPTKFNILTLGWSHFIYLYFHFATILLIHSGSYFIWKIASSSAWQKTVRGYCRLIFEKKESISDKYNATLYVSSQDHEELLKKITIIRTPDFSNMTYWWTIWNLASRTISGLSNSPTLLQTH